MSYLPYIQVNSEYWRMATDWIRYAIRMLYYFPKQGIILVSKMNHSQIKQIVISCKTFLFFHSLHLKAKLNMDTIDNDKVEQWLSVYMLYLEKWLKVLQQNMVWYSGFLVKSDEKQVTIVSYPKSLLPHYKQPKVI